VRNRLSAGRVQSIASRLVVDREREIRNFVPEEYWTLDAELAKQQGDGAGSKPQSFTARLIKINNQDADFKVEGDVKPHLDVLQNSAYAVQEIVHGTRQRRPAPPFTTSTLQQEASRRLNFNARRTMSVAQQLYEGIDLGTMQVGLITYMRTDSVHLSEQALRTIRQRVTDQYGPEFLSRTPRQYRTQAKGAQEAHEAIRPAGAQMPTADELGLSGQEYGLYNLIWKRTIATQMADARLRLTTVQITVDNAEFRAVGRRVLFPGFFRAYVEGADDPSAALDDQETLLPPLKAGEHVRCTALEPLRHDTKPPARYTDATLVKALESEGIGRPSTYATIISTIEERGYVRKAGKQLIPTFTAFAVNCLLEQHFPDLVDMDFTAQMEQVLDEIAEGRRDGPPYLNTFYLGDKGLEQQVKVKEREIDPRALHALVLEEAGARVRVGRYGAYLEQERDGELLRVSLPNDMPPADLVESEIKRLLSEKKTGPTPLGYDPASGEPIFVLQGPYGPYVQRGENGNSEGKSRPKPQRVSLPKGVAPESVTLDQAIALLNLPRTLGRHPDSGEPVEAGIGRFGPYVRHNGEYRSLAASDDVLTVTLERALALLAQAKGRQRTELLRELGPHPDDGEPVGLYDGRYGPFVKHGKLNASLPKDMATEQVTLESALALLAKKAVARPRRKKSTSAK